MNTSNELAAACMLKLESGEVFDLPISMVDFGLTPLKVSETPSFLSVKIAKQSSFERLQLKPKDGLKRYKQSKSSNDACKKKTRAYRMNCISLWCLSIEFVLGNTEAYQKYLKAVPKATASKTLIQTKDHFDFIHSFLEFAVTKQKKNASVTTDELASLMQYNHDVVAFKFKVK